MNIDTKSKIRIQSPNLSPHLQASLEWWFFQGYFEGKNTPRTQFMVSLFRQASAPDVTDGHMLLVSTLGEHQNQHAFTSQVSPGLIDNFLDEIQNELGKSEISENLVQAYLSEISRHRAPTPIAETDDTILSEPDNLNISWGDCKIRQIDNTIHLAFRLPDDGPICEFELSPETTWLREEHNKDQSRFGSMAYVSCPRLSIVGTCDSQRIDGEVWMDHQWGDYGWLRTEDDNANLLGWNWFGINLDDQTDLIVGYRHELNTNKKMNSWAIRFVPGSEPKVIDNVLLSERRRWISQKSMASYPVEWRIEISEIDADLIFSPLIDDQEIPVFGVITAIWEGVGTASGTIEGQRVNGRARLELQGYGNTLAYKPYLKRWVDRIDLTLQNFLPHQLDDHQLALYAGQPRWSYDAHAQTEMLSEPTWDLMNRGGKHWRPIYGFLLLDAFGVKAEPYETLISVVPELIHNGSVIVDDIEDASETRRGDETIHRRYGIPTAINAGNLLYFLPLLSLSEHPHLCAQQRADIYRVIIQMFVQAHMGQGQDLFWSKHDQIRGTKFWQGDNLGQLILQAHAFKTAASVRAITEIICIIAKSPTSIREICSRFGESWGVAFQIVDDVNNFTTKAGWGKTRGEDIAAGKTSYVIHKAINLLDGEAQNELIQILDDADLRNSDCGLQRGIKLVEQSGALEECRDEAKALVENEWPAFSEALPHSQSKIAIRLLITNLLDLPFEM